ncbi:MAG: hypothetical protein EXR71_17300 [Myxococcales bacterium]|nr:hypothetical protein [Myxococcales bacterium]
MLLTLFIACALHVERAGMVTPHPGGVWLDGYQGGRVALVLTEASAPIRYLDGCVVEVRGMQTPAGLVVEDWLVKDAGDGSGGFVGTLRAYGARLLLEDRNTQTTLTLDDQQVPELRVYAGKPVLIVGTVVGPGQVRVMAWRLLTDGG